jgi:WD40 repeat protein
MHTAQARVYLLPSNDISLYHSYLNYKSNSQSFWKQNIDQFFINKWGVQWEIKPPTYQESCVFMMEISSDKRHLAFSRESTEIELWDIASKQCLNKINAHNDIVTSFTFSHGDPTFFFTASLDRKICVWKNNVKVTELTQHRDWLRCLSLSEQNQTLLSG